MSAPPCAAAPTPTPIATVATSILADSDAAATLSEPLSADPHVPSPSPTASIALAVAFAASSSTTASSPEIVAPVPTETHFASREELLSYVHAFALSNGYAVVIHKSNVPRGQVWLGCDLGGSYRPLMNADGTRKRKCSSRLQNCPFQLYARRLPDSQWLLKVQHATHNHAIDGQGPEQLAAHPIARRLTLAQKQLVDELTTLGARPAHILETLKEQFPDKPIKVQDIYNTRNYIRRERSAGRVPFANELRDAASQSGTDAGVAAASSSGLSAAVLGVTERPLALPVDGLAAEQTTSDAAATDGDIAGPAPTTELLQLDGASAPALSSVSSVPDHASPSSSSQATAAAPAIATASILPSRASERLETLLSDVHTRFADWQPRTQSQFLLQLDVLLRKCRKSDARAVASLEARSMQSTVEPLAPEPPAPAAIASEE